MIFSQLCFCCSNSHIGIATCVIVLLFMFSGMQASTLVRFNVALNDLEQFLSDVDIYQYSLNHTETEVDSLLNTWDENFLNSVANREEEYYETSYFGLPKDYRVIYGRNSTASYPYARYIFGNAYESSCYPFQQLSSHEIVMPENIATMIEFYLVSDTLSYRVEEDTLFIAPDSLNFQPFLYRCNSVQSNFLGSFYFIRYYDEVDFYEYRFTDVSEYFLVVDYYGAFFEYLFWFDEDYQVLRFEKRYGPNGWGFMVIDEAMKL